jgi:serine/threonine-protein kinase
VEVASQRLREPPVPPREIERDVSADLDSVVLRAMALEPAMRHHDARELADDLRRFAAPDPVRRTEVITTRRGGPDEGTVPTTRPGQGARGGPVVAADTGPDPGETEPWSALRRLGIALVVLAVLVLAGAAVVLLAR